MTSSPQDDRVFHRPELEHNAGFVNYQEDDEVTQIHEITLLEYCPFFSWIVVPILCVLTALILAICMFWKPSLRASLCYRKVSRV